MKHAIVAAVLMMALAGAVNAQTADKNSSAQAAEKAALQMENKVNQAIGHNDWRTVSHIWAPNMVYIDGKGRLLTQADFVNSLKDGSRKFLFLRHSQVRAHAYGSCGDLVAVTGYSTSHIRLNGKLSVGPRRFTDVWAKRDGAWHLVVHHVTNVAK